MTRDVSTKRFPLPAAPLLLWVLLLSVAVFLPARVLAADAKRGDEPRCQEECLREHVDKMKLLSQEYTKIRNKMEYQDQVEIEFHNYSHCLTNCRDLLPIK